MKPRSRGGNPHQLELPLTREREPDRNLHRGGRSFYFFDFDDNVAFLATPMFLFHRETGAEIEISSREFGRHSGMIGRQGPYADYRLDPDPARGSFRAFRDRPIGWLARVLRGERQLFVRDLGEALRRTDLEWKGPSWDCFYHAVFNGRPISLITARGHHPRTIREGIELWVREGYLPCVPNYLSIYPVSHPDVKAELNLSESEDIPLLKQRALRASVRQALRRYGDNPHRFGMSDDDPRNVEWITAEMRELKRELPHLSFFIIATHGEKMVKHEVFADRVEDRVLDTGGQLSLFDE